MLGIFTSDESLDTDIMADAVIDDTLEPEADAGYIDAPNGDLPPAGQL
jgi:hypothetical protein